MNRLWGPLIYATSYRRLGLHTMGSSHYRIRGIDLVARCCHGVFYAVGFLTTTLVFMAMLWILWCYFGLALVHVSDGQRRAVVHYPLPSSKSQVSSTSVLPNQGADAVSKSVDTSPAFLRGSSRGESQIISGTERTNWSGGGNASLAKGDYAARDRIYPGAKDASIHLSDSNLESGEEKAEGVIPSDEDDGLQVRRIPSSYDNRHDFSKSPKDKDARRRGDIENPNMKAPDLTSDAKSVGAANITRNITSSRANPPAEQKDKIQSSKNSNVGTPHHDLVSDIDSKHTPNRTRISEDDSRGSRSQYDARDRGRDKGGETDDSYSKGDTRLHHDHDKTADDSHHGDEKIHSHDGDSHADHSNASPRRRGDDDRHTDYDDTYKSHGDRHYYRDDRYKTLEGRHRIRDDERYASKDDDRYRSVDEERYRSKDGEDGSTRADTLRDHGRDTSRVDDRYRARDMDRSRIDSRYITKDDDEDRYRDDDRDRYWDEGRYRTRYREGDRSRYGENYRPRVDNRDRSTEDFAHERGSQNTRYSDSDGYYTRDDEDRYRDDSRTPSRASSTGNSNLEVPSRTILSESRYKVTDNGDDYKRPTRYDDRDRISPTRVREDSYYSRPTIMDSRSRSETIETVLTDSRRMDDDRFPQGSKRYQDDSRREYRTRMPDENTRYAPRYEDDLALERRSYGSEKDDEYSSRTRYYDDRRYFRTRDEEYPRRSRPYDDEEYTRRRTDEDGEYPRRRTTADEEYPRRRTSDDEEYPRRRTNDDEEYPRRRTSDDEEYPRRRPDDEDFRRSRPRGYYDTSRTRYRDKSEEYDRDDDRYDDDRIRRRYDDRSRRTDGYNHRKEVDSDSSTDDGRGTPKRIAPDSTRPEDADGSLAVERPLSAKDVIEAALRESDMNDKNPVRKVSYPVFDPRVSNLTSPEIIRPSERRGITIHSRKKRWLRV